MNAPIHIAMWSGPRNISTAMMRSFSSRSDCAVTDEPFYGAFLKTSGEPHPVAKDIMADMDCGWQSVANAMRGEVPDGKTIWYQKHMPHHMVADVDIMDFPDHKHIFLIRDPDRVAASYAAKNDLYDAVQLGFAQLRDYHSRISNKQGKAAIVIDSDDVLNDPEAALSNLCAKLGINWQVAMLGWPKGPHPADGIWADHWYGAVLNSTGFGSTSIAPILSPEHQAIADSCRKDFDQLKAIADFS